MYEREPELSKVVRFERTREILSPFYGERSDDRVSELQEVRVVCPKVVCA